MTLLPRVLALPLLLVVLVAASCGSATGSTAISVGGVDYNQDDLRADMEDSIVDGTAAVEETSAWLTNWAFWTAIGLELEKNDIVPTEADVDAARLELASTGTFDPEGSGSELRVSQVAVRNAALEWARGEFPDAPPVELDPADVPNMLCSRHILLETEPEALDVLARLDDGEDFAALASELSLDPGSGQSGGELGCVPEGAFVPEFEAAAYPAADGDIVGPVASAFGFHVIEVLSAGPATVEEHPDAGQEQIDAAVASATGAAQAAAQSDVDALRTALLEELQAGAFADYADTVTVASEFGTWDPDAFRVVGPGGAVEAG